MSAYAEQPFSDFEERYFLAEIIKRSNLPPAHLFAIIRDNRIEPAWNDIALPHGRSVSACQQAYNALSTRMAVPPQPAPPPVAPPQLSPLAPVDPSRGVKRPYSSMGDATTTLPRELQPRPPGYPGINGQQLVFPPPAPMAPVAPQRKKRGRPTKAEWERRQAEAQERGEIWPKPRKAKARPSMEAGEASKSGSGEKGLTPGGAVGSTALETPGSAAASAPTPSPDASRSVSGGPVQPQPGASYGPEGPAAASSRAPEQGTGRPIEGAYQHAQSAAPPHPPPSPYASQSTPKHSEAQLSAGGSAQTTYASHSSQQTPPEQRGR